MYTGSMKCHDDSDPFSCRPATRKWECLGANLESAECLSVGLQRNDTRLDPTRQFAPSRLGMRLWQKPRNQREALGICL
jgi:hypothetical protein